MPNSKTERFIRNPDVAWKEMEGQGILLDVHTGDYFEVDEVGLLIWTHLDGRRDLDAIAERITRTYQVTKPTALKDAGGFLRKLDRRGLARRVAS